MAASNTGRVIIWLAAFGIALLVFLYFKGCGKGVSVPETKIDTVYHDSIQIVTIVDTYYVPKPYKVTVIDSSQRRIVKENPSAWLLDSAYYAALRSAYFETKYYKDTVYNDSAGFVIVSDTLSENTLLGRGVNVHLENTIVEREILITKTLPRKLTGYWGVKAGGNKSNLFTTAGLTFGLMDKKGRYYGIDANLLLNNKPFYGAQVMLPIHFKK